MRLHRLDVGDVIDGLVVLAENVGEQRGLVVAGERGVQGIGAEDQVSLAGLADVGFGDLEHPSQLAVARGAAELLGEPLPALVTEVAFDLAGEASPRYACLSSAPYWAA